MTDWSEETKRAVADDIEWLRRRDEEQGERLVRVTAMLAQADQVLAKRVAAIEDALHLHDPDGHWPEFWGREAPPKGEDAPKLSRWRRANNWLLGDATYDARD